jgi:hypothetical protein
MHFESEIGSEFFEVVMKWHSRSGPIHTKPGFRMPDIFNLMLDFQIPWLNGAVECPDKFLPKTFEFLRVHFIGDQYDFRRKWIEMGLEAMRDKFVDYSSRYYMNVPLIFLCLTHRKQCMYIDASFVCSF